MLTNNRKIDQAKNNNTELKFSLILRQFLSVNKQKKCSRSRSMKIPLKAKEVKRKLSSLKLS